MEYWFYEEHTKNVRWGLRIKNEIAHVKSDFQDIHLFETYDFGKTLVIDGTIQTTERDEFIYHEMIVHPPMLTHPSPRKILIIGGGDGGAAREVLKHDPQEVIVVDIDAAVIELSKKHMKFLSKAYSDDRVKIVVGDGIEYVKKHGGFDVIIIDSTDPVGPAEGLFKKEFYDALKKSLNDGGIISQQCGTPFYHPEELKNSYVLLSKIFKFVKPYLAHIPTYPSGMWSFVMASDDELKLRRVPEFETKYFTEELYYASMSLPKFIKEYCRCNGDK